MKKITEKKETINNVLENIRKEYENYLVTANLKETEYSFYNFCKDCFLQYKRYVTYESARRIAHNKIEFIIENYNSSDPIVIVETEKAYYFLEVLFSQAFGDWFTDISPDVITVCFFGLNDVRRRMMGIDQGFNVYQDNMFFAQIMANLLKSCYPDKEEILSPKCSNFTKRIKDYHYKKLKRLSSVDEFQLYIPKEMGLISNFEVLLDKSENLLNGDKYSYFASLLAICADRGDSNEEQTIGYMEARPSATPEEYEEYGEKTTNKYKNLELRKFSSIYNKVISS
jgi:hypothetical protein